jgi:hypothetical protein
MTLGGGDPFFALFNFFAGKNLEKKRKNLTNIGGGGFFLVIINEKS